jgi:hypothetical protein
MKPLKRLLVTFTILLVGPTGVTVAAQRMVVGEMFTNTS